MHEKQHHQLVNYGIALIATAVTLAVRLLLHPWIGDAVPHMAFFPAVIIAAYYGGFRPGFLTTLLGAFLANFVFTAPYLSLGFKDLNSSVALPIFVLVGGMISGLFQSLHGMQQRIVADERRWAEQAVRETEDRFRGTFENAAIGIAHTDAAGRFLLINQHFCAILGYSREEMLRKTFQDITYPDDLAVSVEPFDKLMRGESAGFSLDKRYRRKDGSVVWVELFVSLQRDSGGKPAYAIAMLQDLSERKRLEGELRRAKEVAEAANRAKDEFLTNVSHEIRTPMNAILGMTELVLDSPLPLDQRQCLRTVKSAADNLLIIINDLLDFSKIEAGKLELDSGAFSLREELVDMVRALSVRAHKKGLKLMSHVDPAVPDSLVGDSVRLRQVMLNLIGNAIKFTNVGEVLVRLELAGELTSEKVGVRFSVSDTGIGIPRDRQDIVFRAFEQADTSTTRKFGGTGLGLTIASRLVALMGGTILVESEPDRGSTFAFTVHLGRSTRVIGSDLVGPEESLSPEQEYMPVLSPGAGDLRILIAEDDEFNAELLERLLERRGHTVRRADNGRTALAMAQEGALDVLLLDVHMPELDGFQVIHALREWERFAGGHLHVIALTARSRAEDRERCLAAGMDEFLSKPIQTDHLWQAMDRVVGDRRPVDRPKEALLDTRVLWAACGGDEAILSSICRTFRGRLPQHLAAIQAALQQRDAARLREDAHRLCGMIGTFSTVAANVASDLEDHAAEGRLEEARPLLEQLEAMVDELVELASTVTIHTLRSG